MPWIELTCQEYEDKHRYENMGLTPKEEDYFWTTKVVRSEDIMEFYKVSDKRLALSFYDERPIMNIKNISLEDLAKRLQELDYDESIEEIEG